MLKTTPTLTEANLSNIDNKLSCKKRCRNHAYAVNIHLRKI